MSDCTLGLGFEHINPGAISAVFKNRPSPFKLFDRATEELVDQGDIRLALRYLDGVGLVHNNPNLDEITATQLAVNREIEQRPIAKALMFVEIKANGPNVSRLELAFTANILSCVPGAALVNGRIKV